MIIHSFLRQWAFIKSLYKPPPKKNKIVCVCIYICMYVKWRVDGGGNESGGDGGGGGNESGGE